MAALAAMPAASFSGTCLARHKRQVRACWLVMYPYRIIPAGDAARIAGDLVQPGPLMETAQPLAPPVGGASRVMAAGTRMQRTGSASAESNLSQVLSSGD